MTTLQKIRQGQREVDFPISKYQGRNSFGEHSSLAPGEFRDLINWDIYSGAGGDFLKSRRGSDFLTGDAWFAASAPQCAVCWDTGTDEYVIAVMDDTIVYKKLTASGNPTLVTDFAGGAFLMPSIVQPELFIHGDRLFLLSSAGNYVIQFISNAFKIRPLGMAYPFMSTWSQSSAGNLTGVYVWGLEKVYQISGVDVLVSSPNRKTITTRSLFKSTALSARAIEIIINATNLDNDTLWTHLRLWRSKNLHPDRTDPLNPLDAQGLEDELWEVALITRAEMNAGALTAVATGSTLPAGNTNTTAGKPGGAYTIRDNSNDSFLSYFIGLDRIELSPIPASTVGCFHADRIWFNGADARTLQYSNAVGTKYSELYNPLNIKDSGKDGQAITRLFSFERDLIVIKEGKTGRVAGGNVDIPFETLNDRVGIEHHNMACLMEGLGIAALINGNPYREFMILGPDLQWTRTLNGMDISKPVKNDTSITDFQVVYVSMLYINGKVMLFDGLSDEVLVLHHREGKGWGKYSYPIDYSVNYLTASFAGKQRAIVFSGSTRTLEIEVDDRDTDDSIEDGSEGLDIDLSHTTHMFKDGDGKSLLEFERYDINAALSNPVVVIPFANGLPWPSQTSETETPHIVLPKTFIRSELRDRDYRFFLEPQAVGPYYWQRMQGNRLHFRFETVAPATIRSQGLRAVVDDSDSANWANDPFQNLTGLKDLPTWGSDVEVHLTFDELTGTRAYDASGRGRYFDFTAGSPVGTAAYSASIPPGGGWSITRGGASSGTYYGSSWTAVDYIGDDSGENSEDYTFEWSGAIPTLSAGGILAQGGNGTKYWRLYVNSDGSIQFELRTSALTYQWTTAAGVITAGASTYFLIQFVLTDGGGTGKFYAAGITSDFASLTTTRASHTPVTAPSAARLVVNSTSKIGHFRMLLEGRDEQRAQEFHEYVRLKAA